MALILLCEDNDSLRTVIRMLLESRGHTAVEAATGREAIACLKRETFDAALVDLVLPELTGVEVLHWLQRHHPQVPTIAMTGQSERHARKAWEAGIARLIYKPFTPAELLATITAALAGEHQARPPADLDFRPKPSPGTRETSTEVSSKPVTLLHPENQKAAESPATPEAKIEPPRPAPPRVGSNPNAGKHFTRPLAAPPKP